MTAANSVRLLATAVLCLFLQTFTVLNAGAHPMPNTVIALELGDSRIAIDITIPAPELLLALTGNAREDAHAYLEKDSKVLRAYMAAHLAVYSKSGAHLPSQVSTISLESAKDAHVGAYQEFRFMVEVPVPAGLNAREFSLQYDAVIHKIPNHFALVRIHGGSRSGLAGGKQAVAEGIIRYDFATATVLPFPVGPGHDKP